MPDLTELQRRILEAKRDDPSASATEIADRVDCSEGYAREILDKYDTAYLEAANETEPASSSDESDDSSMPFLMWLILAPIGLAIRIIVESIRLSLWLLKLILPPYGK